MNVTFLTRRASRSNLAIQAEKLNEKNEYKNIASIHFSENAPYDYREWIVFDDSGFNDLESLFENLNISFNYIKVWYKNATLGCAHKIYIKTIE